MGRREYIFLQPRYDFLFAPPWSRSRCSMNFGTENLNNNSIYIQILKLNQYLKAKNFKISGSITMYTHRCVTLERDVVPARERKKNTTLNFRMFELKDCDPNTRFKPKQTNKKTISCSDKARKK